MFVLSTSRKGAIGETKIAAAATELGISVLRPIVNQVRYDLAFEIGEYSESEIDLVAVYCHELDRCYLLPIALVAGRRAIFLRLKPPRNRPEGMH